LIGIRGRADGASALAAHATVLALGLLLTAPIVLARHGQPQLAAAHARQVTFASVPFGPRDPMAFEQAKPAPADEGSTGTVEWIPAPVGAPPPVVIGAVVAPAPPATAGVGVQAIYAVFGSSPGLTWALRVAHCESRYNPLAVNASSGASGLFQFMPSTWNAYFAGWNIWDPYAQARAALVFYNRGATNAWTCK
jgi:soluble lytic murein transglycosylase-like protein